MFKHVEAQFQILVRYVVVFVAVVWLCILLSLIVDADQEKSDSWHFYNANIIIMISILSLLGAFFTLVIGFRTALALQKELAAVFVSNAVTHNNFSRSKQRGNFLLSSLPRRNTILNAHFKYQPRQS
jgi:fumarate reductase subunit C